ncbi:threonine--tRNA ligase [Candidatus Daviesbacteria bacterium]|nr:threonine--tRNA ligase [Candidatus Daviesbacteria bacterium]
MAQDTNLENIRHSCAHLLAAAVVKLWPDTKNTIGPATDNGFYYDFDFKNPISEEDFSKIEAEMAKILRTWDKFDRVEVTFEEAKERFKDNPYKLELIDELEKEGQQITLYKSGNFIDLCKGGHSENPQEDIGAIKLIGIAGAYWRGNEKNKMLTRIYGACFRTKNELEEHLKLLEEAKKKDHRILGESLELFTTSVEIGPGLILWLPKGTLIKEELEKLGKETEFKYGYQRVSTPHIAKESLYKLSGHLPYFATDMFPPMKSEEGNYYLKPMNCPHMHMIYKSKLHSYRDFPIRYAEFGTVYRFEDSGTLMGLLRVRGHTQNDAHIYCGSEEQALEELVAVMKLHEYYFKIFGIKDFYIELALPDFEKKKDKYFDNPKAWEKAVSLLRKAAKQSGVEVVEDVGGAAFYGPKFDFNIKSATGRKFSITTNQLDFGSGDRFKLKFTDQDGAEKIVPYIIHRAPLGSDERFIGYLIELFGGAFPTWLSPTQVKIIPISDKNLSYGQKLLEQFKEAGIRAELDDKNSTMQSKIRDGQLQKIPYMVVVGEREEKEKKITVRSRRGESKPNLDLKMFLKDLNKEIADRS